MAVLDIGLNIQNTDSNSHIITIFAFFNYDLSNTPGDDFIDGDLLNMISQSDDLSSAVTFPIEPFQIAGLVNPAGGREQSARHSSTSMNFQAR